MLRTCLVVMFVAALNSQAEAGGRVARGRVLFERQWQDSEGAGPLFNARSCVGCHCRGGTGGAGDQQANVDVLTVLRTGKIGMLDSRLSTSGASAVLHVANNDDESYRLTRFKLLGLGHQLKSAMPSSDPAWHRVSRAEQRVRDKGPRIRLNVKGGQLELSQRSTPALFGSGLIDDIPLQTMRETTVALTRQFPHVTGRIAGRFGWRGQTLNLRQFVVAACDNELGLTEEDAKIEEKDPILRDKWELEDDLVDFIKALPRPKQTLPPGLIERNVAKQGRQLFHTAGCTACHVPNLGEVEGLYSDLALHDMGRGLADSAGAPLPGQDLNPQPKYYSSGPPVPDAPLGIVDAARREWKTPPLWGVATSAPYLHDGRAATLNDAILMHSGEATQSVALYRRLGGDGRRRLVAFLQTLRGPNSRDVDAVGR